MGMFTFPPMSYDLIRCHLSPGYVGLYIINKTNELRRICD